MEIRVFIDFLKRPLYLENMKRDNLPDTFSAILLAEKEADYNVNSRIVDSLNSKGFSISKRTMQKYEKGTLVPDYALAKEIFKVLHLNYGESDLLEILTRSKEKMIMERSLSLSKTINPDEFEYIPSFLKKRISISAEEFSFLEKTNVSSDYVIDLIEQRIKEEYGDNRYSFNRYIRDLIDADMKRYEKK